MSEWFATTEFSEATTVTNSLSRSTDESCSSGLLIAAANGASTLRSFATGGMELPWKITEVKTTKKNILNIEGGHKEYHEFPTKVFDRNELAQLARDVGFSVLKHQGDFLGSPLSETSPFQIILLEKPC